MITSTTTIIPTLYSTHCIFTMTSDMASNKITSPLLNDDEMNTKYKDEDTPSKLEKEQTLIDGKRVMFYIAVFFFSMILHELSLEAASTSFSHLDSLAAAVTLFQFGFCFMLPFIVTRGKVCETFPRTAAEVKPYIKLSFLVFGATALATQSLKYVDYPTKVVFKSSKLIPTMIVSKFFHGKSYAAIDYCSALLICLGAAGFSYNADATSSDSSFYGIALLTISILCDALVPNVQKELMSNSLPTDKESMQRIGLSAQAVMINTNAVGFCMLVCYMVVSGAAFDAVQTVLVHPKLLLYLVSVGICLSTAVLAYTNLIKSTSPVIAVATTTLRKVATIVLSYIIFPKQITMIHFASLILVLAGIVLSAFFKRR